MNHADSQLLRLGLVLAGGGARVRRLVARLPSAETDLEALANIGAPRALLATADRLAASEAPEVIRRISEIGWRWVVPGDGDYPELLEASSDPPLGLFVRGELKRSPAVAIVGARRATPYGLQVARLLGEELGRGGVVVVSGMARGVDEAAHRGCLEVGGSSWAVWGAGPDRIYPPEHARLANELAATGALVTEYPPGTPPRRHHFPERNRVIAALTAAVVVVEAAARSGALITARAGDTIRIQLWDEDPLRNDLIEELTLRTEELRVGDHLITGTDGLESVTLRVIPRDTNELKHLFQ